MRERPSPAVAKSSSGVAAAFHRLCRLHSLPLPLPPPLLRRIDRRGEAAAPGRCRPSLHVRCLSRGAGRRGRQADNHQEDGGPADGPVRPRRCAPRAAAPAAAGDTVGGAFGEGAHPVAHGLNVTLFKSKAKLILKWRAGLETKDTNQLDAMQRDFDELTNGIFGASVVRLPLPLQMF